MKAYRTFSIDTEILKKFDEICKKENVNKSAVIEICIKEWIQKNNQ